MPLDTGAWTGGGGEPESTITFSTWEENFDLLGHRYWARQKFVDGVRVPGWEYTSIEPASFTPVVLHPTYYAPEPEVFRCVVCGEQFSTNIARLAHYSIDHPDRKPAPPVETPLYLEPPKQDAMPNYTCPVGYYLRTGSQYVGPGNPDGVMCVNLKNDEDQIMPTAGPGGYIPEAPTGTDEKGPPDLIDPGSLDFTKNQWTGYVTKKDFGYEGNFLSLGPLPPGTPSQISTIVLLIALNRLSKTPEGLKVVQQLATKYLDNIGEIIKGIHFSSSSNVYTALINAYTAQPIYMRLGLMSPRDCTQNRAWIDHVMGEMLKAAYFKDSLSGLTTLVNSTSTGGGESGEKATGLGTLAKVLGA